MDSEFYRQKVLRANNYMIGGGDKTNDNKFVSKTAVKKAMHELQALGEDLLNLSSNQLQRLIEQADLTLNDDLIKAIIQAKKIKPGNGRRRQLQYIGKLLRSEDVKKITKALKHFHNHPKLEEKELITGFNSAQHWLKQFLVKQHSSHAIAKFFAEHPQCDRQHIKQLLRNTLKEKDHKKSKKHQEILLAAITSILETNNL